MTKSNSTNDHRNLEIKINGQASGIVLKGGGAGQLSKEESENAASQLQQKLNPSLVGICKAFADELKTSTTPPPSPTASVSGAGVGRLFTDRDTDLDGWCRQHGFERSTNIDGTGSGWRCIPGTFNIDFQRVCRDQAGPNYTAILTTPPPGGMYDWKCRDRRF